MGLGVSASSCLESGSCLANLSKQVPGTRPILIAFLYWGDIGIMENEMETTIICWGYKGLY